MDEFFPVNVNVKVVFQPAPVKFMAVQCPSCNSWFGSCDIVKDSGGLFHTMNEKDIIGADCECPKCGRKFAIAKDSSIKTSDSASEIYEGCLKKKIIWE